jgi:sulfur carrier protein
MRIALNGEQRELPEGATLADAVRESGAQRDGRGVAVALDGEVVPRAEWDATALAEGRSVEVLAAIQGGAADTTGFVFTPSRRTRRRRSVVPPRNGSLAAASGPRG